MLFLTTFFSILPEDLTASISYAKDLISNFLPLILLFLGVFLGVYIVYKIVGMVR